MNFHAGLLQKAEVLFLVLFSQVNAESGDLRTGFGNDCAVFFLQLFPRLQADHVIQILHGIPEIVPVFQHAFQHGVRRRGRHAVDPLGKTVLEGSPHLVPGDGDRPVAHGLRTELENFHIRNAQQNTFLDLRIQGFIHRFRAADADEPFHLKCEKLHPKAGMKLVHLVKKPSVMGK